MEEGRGFEPPSGVHPGATAFRAVCRPNSGTFLGGDGATRTRIALRLRQVSNLLDCRFSHVSVPLVRFERTLYRS